MRFVSAIAAAIIAAAAVGCSAPPAPRQETPTPPPAAEQPTPPSPAPEEPGKAEGIFAMELEDVVTGESFTLADLRGKPVLLHPFAVW
jgi:cytochrome oxidase Cu insertion factor (SCO1/SenC/PrrC family)